MLAGQPGTAALDARTDPFDLAHVPAKWTPVRRQEHAQTNESRACSDSEGPEQALAASCELAVRRAVESFVAEQHSEPVGSLDRAATPVASPAPVDDLRIDQSHRLLVADDSGGRVRLALIVAAAAALVGSVSVGLLGGFSFIKPHAAAPVAQPQSPAPSPAAANASKTDRLPHRTIAREPERAPATKPPPRPHAVTPTRIARPKPSPAVAAPLPAAYTPPAPIAVDSAARTEPPAPLVPVPETRPTTIDGWMLREVVDGTAVLEGPNGLVRARRGDTVAGVGRVVDILRWGNRLIVTTDSGLISTP